ncbi:DNA polymerase III subunit beta [Patescibacteria group bacterium]
MKFSCTQENLNRGLGVVSHIAAKNANLPILHNVLVSAQEGGIELTATNLEIGIRARVRGKVEEEGSFTVPAQVFANYVGLISAERVDLEKKETNLFINAGNQNTKLRGEEANEFPLIPDVEKNEPLTVLATELKEALGQTLVAASHDDSRPELTGVLFHVKDNQIILASTDSYRLAERKLLLPKKVEKERSIIIPAAALSELVRVFTDNEEEEVQIYFSDSQALFVTPEVEITTRLIEGSFPDYEQIIPQEERTTVIIDKDALVKAVKAASLFSKSGIHDVNIHFSPEKQEVTLTTVNNQLGENVSKVEAEIKGDSNNIIFNYRYLLDGASQIPTKKTRIVLVDNTSPGVFRPHGNEDEETGEVYSYIIMPIKQ